MKPRRDLKKKRARRAEQRRMQRAARSISPLSATVPTPDEAASAEIRAAMVQTDRLLRLVEFPLRIESTVTPEPRVLDNWEIAAPAMLFSAANCLLSIRLLATVAGPRREQDAVVLLRRLFEHVVDFAWIAIDPAAHAKKWVAEDFYYRLKIDDEFTKLGQTGLTPANRANFDQYVGENGRMPDVASRADAADKHWSQRITGHGVFPAAAVAFGQTIVNAQGGSWSLRTLYTVIYRAASAAAHPTPTSLSSYVCPAGGPGRFVVGMDPTDHEARIAYTHAPFVYSTMLLVAEHVLGRPRRGDVEAAFES